MPEGVRIQKVLADAGVASRRGAETLVQQGRVAVNGSPAAVGQRVDPAADRISVDGTQVSSAAPRLYLAMHKPAGVTSTVSDRHAFRTVLDLVPEALRPRGSRLYPVGRLDRDSEGLLLLTNDGDWAERLLHPRFGVEREYAVGLHEAVTSSQARALGDGIRLEEGVARLASLRPSTGVEVGLAEPGEALGRGRLRWYQAVIRQGWKRQLRRMFAAVDAPVQRLVRVRIGALLLAGLSPGQVRSLTETERVDLGGVTRDTTTPATETTQGERGLVVSLDGPGSSGKSTVGAGAAAELGYRFCDTGVLYRALTWLALERGVHPDDASGLVLLTEELQLAADERGRLRHVRVGGVDVTDQIHSADVDREVSRVSRHADVRAALLPVQRVLAGGGQIIVAGRDIGTVVLPDADLKLYIDVAVDERARRRALERGVDPSSGEGAAILAELRRRDGLDSTRAVAPLRIPEGATVIRSDTNTLAETVAEVVSAIRARDAPERTMRHETSTP